MDPLVDSAEGSGSSIIGAGESRRRLRSLSESLASFSNSFRSGSFGDGVMVAGPVDGKTDEGQMETALTSLGKGIHLSFVSRSRMAITFSCHSRHKSR